MSEKIPALPIGNKELCRMALNPTSLESTIASELEAFNLVLSPPRIDPYHWVKATRARECRNTHGEVLTYDVEWQSYDTTNYVERVELCHSSGECLISFSCNNGGLNVKELNGQEYGLTKRGATRRNSLLGPYDLIKRDQACPDVSRAVIYPGNAEYNNYSTDPLLSFILKTIQLTDLDPIMLAKKTVSLFNPATEGKRISDFYIRPLQVSDSELAQALSELDEQEK